VVHLPPSIVRLRRSGLANLRFAGSTPQLCGKHTLQPRPVRNGALAGETNINTHAIQAALRLGAELKALRPVAETLLMAVLLHALFALVLIDLGLTAFLNGSHGVCRWC